MHRETSWLSWSSRCEDLDEALTERSRFAFCLRIWDCFPYQISQASWTKEGRCRWSKVNLFEIRGSSAKTKESRVHELSGKESKTEAANAFQLGQPVDKTLGKGFASQIPDSCPESSRTPHFLWDGYF